MILERLIIPKKGIIIPNMSMVNGNNNSNNISNVLFSKAQQDVLGLLYGQPDTDFYTNEIIRQTHAGTGAVQRELTKLVLVGILTVKQVGNQKHYQANHSNPFFAELRSIVLKTFGLADVIKNAIMPLHSKLRSAFIYGSVAKQEDNAESDIDLMFIEEDITYADFFNLLAPVEVQLGRKINPIFYTPKDWSRKKTAENHFIMELLKQPKIFLIGTENELNVLG